MRNIRLTLSYDGTDFYGWQRQPSAPTIQGQLEAALEKILGAPAPVWGSGRTDAGVHALNQVANFKTECRIPGANLLKALNDALPPAVRVKEVRQVEETFHARYDARAKTYRYRIHQAAIASPFIGRFAWHYPHPLDRENMAEAARLVEGEHDFTSFAASAGAVHEPPPPPGVREDLYGPPARQWAREHDECVAPPDRPAHEPTPERHEGAPRFDDASMVRTIFSSRVLWRPRTSMLIYEARGSGFLHHMVRNLAGTLVEVGKGKLEPRDMLRILQARDRTRAGPRAPAQGLCLVNVEY